MKWRYPSKPTGISPSYQKERRDGAYEMEEPIKRRQDFTISKLRLRDSLVNEVK